MPAAEQRGQNTASSKLPIPTYLHSTAEFGWYRNSCTATGPMPYAIPRQVAGQWHACLDREYTFGAGQESRYAHSKPLRWASKSKRVICLVP